MSFGFVATYGTDGYTAIVNGDNNRAVGSNDWDLLAAKAESIAAIQCATGQDVVLSTRQLALP